MKVKAWAKVDDNSGQIKRSKGQRGNGANPILSTVILYEGKLTEVMTKFLYIEFNFDMLYN